MSSLWPQYPTSTYPSSRSLSKRGIRAPSSRYSYLLMPRSDKTLHALAKTVQSELVPAHDNNGLAVDPSSILPLDAIEQAIKAVATRCNYGLESINGASKIPAALHAWRWEVKEDHVDWLPKAAKEKLEARLAERRQACAMAYTRHYNLTYTRRSKTLRNCSTHYQRMRGVA